MAAKEVTMAEIRQVGNGNYEAAKKLRRKMRNPWLAEEIDRIPRDPYWRREFCAVVASYAMSEGDGYEPFDCEDCGSKVWFKNTIGCFKCTGCPNLFHSNREKV